MTDIADEIRKAVASGAPPRNPGETDEEFMKLRAHVRGTLISANRQLTGTDEHSVTDDRILDIVTAWLEAKRRK